MLVDIMTAIIGPFGFCTGKLMQMSNDSHYWLNSFFEWQGRSGLEGS